jgi:hypothetical protein
MFRHRYYSQELKTAAWATILLNFFGLILLDGGVFGCIVLIASLAFWIGALRPLTRKQPNSSDRQYLAYGFIITIGLSTFISPAVWHLRGRF